MASCGMMSFAHDLLGQVFVRQGTAALRTQKGHRSEDCQGFAGARSLVPVLRVASADHYRHLLARVTRASVNGSETTIPVNFSYATIGAFGPAWLAALLFAAPAQAQPASLWKPA